jgi:hypothetical protein
MDFEPYDEAKHGKPVEDMNWAAFFDAVRIRPQVLLRGQINALYAVAEAYQCRVTTRRLPDGEHVVVYLVATL